MRQRDFFPKGSLHNQKSEFGGGKSHSTHPKNRRSFSRKHSLHVTMRSRFAIGSKSMLATANKAKIDTIVSGNAKRFHVKIYSFVNVGNHLHLVLQTERREWLSDFLRTISALIARHVMKAERGSPLSGGIRFWQARPFSKIITWGKQFRYLVRVYMLKNRLEAVGFTTPAARFYTQIMQT